MTVLVVNTDQWAHFLGGGLWVLLILVIGSVIFRTALDIIIAGWRWLLKD